VWKELSYGVMSEKEKQMLCDEVNILRDLNHPNIVRFVDRIVDHHERKIYIVQEYCNGGDLASYIKMKRGKLPKMSGRISESFIWSVTSEIASALQHCHNHFNRQQNKTANQSKKHRILHRDLKPGNVFLVKRRGTYSVKLGDFGLAKMLDDSSIFAQTHVGTPYYMSPEQIQSKSYDEKSDIWALGCIVYEMAMLHPPFKAANYLHLAEKIKAGTYKKVNCRNYSDELANAVSLMLTVDVEKRAKIEDVLCLPRIQFTSKMLRLDRRYSQLKKKEQQFNLKMAELIEFQNKYKKKAQALLKREHLLKQKEYELKQKEAVMLRRLQQRCRRESAGGDDKSLGSNSNSGSAGSAATCSPGSGSAGDKRYITTSKSVQSNDLSTNNSSAELKISPIPTTSSMTRVTSNTSIASTADDVDDHRERDNREKDEANLIVLQDEMKQHSPPTLSPSQQQPLDERDDDHLQLLDVAEAELDDTCTDTTRQSIQSLPSLHSLTSNNRSRVASDDVVSMAHKQYRQKAASKSNASASLQFVINSLASLHSNS